VSCRTMRTSFYDFWGKEWMDVERWDVLMSWCFKKLMIWMVYDWYWWIVELIRNLFVLMMVWYWRIEGENKEVRYITGYLDQSAAFTVLLVPTPVPPIDWLGHRPALTGHLPALEFSHLPTLKLNFGLEFETFFWAGTTSPFVLDFCYGFDPTLSAESSWTAFCLPPYSILETVSIDFLTAIYSTKALFSSISL
jgi:hypothetical protein